MENAKADAALYLLTGLLQRLNAERLYALEASFALAVHAPWARRAKNIMVQKKIYKMQSMLSLILLPIVYP